LYYQWYFEGGLLTGATLSSYTRSSVQAGHAGNYRVVITNVNGAITSNPAMLTVLPLQPPVIMAQPSSRAAVQGGSAAFSVSATGASPLQFQWRFNGGDLANESNDTLTLANLQPAQFGSYTVRVSNSDGWLVSSPAALTLAVPPMLIPSLWETNLRLSFVTESGPVYAVQYCNALQDPEWQSLTNIVGTADNVVVEDAISTNEPRFFRIQVR